MKKASQLQYLGLMVASWWGYLSSYENRGIMPNHFPARSGTLILLGASVFGVALATQKSSSHRSRVTSAGAHSWPIANPADGDQSDIDDSRENDDGGSADVPAQALADRAGRLMEFEVIAALPFDDFPSLADSGKHLYEVMVWNYYRLPCVSKQRRMTFHIGRNQRPKGRALLVTREVSFLSKGKGALPVIGLGTMEVNDTSGFAKKIAVFVEALESDVTAYARALKAERAKAIRGLRFADYAITKEELEPEFDSLLTSAERERRRAEMSATLWARAFKPVAGENTGYLFLALPDGEYAVDYVFGGNGHPYQVRLDLTDDGLRDIVTVWLPPDSDDPLVRASKKQRLQLSGYFLAVECVRSKNYLSRRKRYLFEDVAAFAAYLDLQRVQ